MREPKNEMTRRQHYVPQFYLRNFTNDTKKFWVYDRLKSEYFISQPKAICQKDFLYETEWKEANSKLGKYVLPNDIEKTFSYQEKEYSDIVKKIIKVCDLPENKNSLIYNLEEKSILGSFVVNLFLRNPYSMRILFQNDTQEDMVENDELLIIEKMLDLMGFGGFESLVEATEKKMIVDERLEGSLPNQLMEEISKMNLYIFQTDKVEFITSEFPVLYDLKVLNEVETEFEHLHLPISPKYALYFCRERLEKRKRLAVLGDEIAEEMNCFYFEMSKEQARYIISESEENLKSIVSKNINSF